MGCNKLLANISIEEVNEYNILNSNYILYSIIASFVAVLGFLNNNVIPIIASMIISPVLAPFYIATAVAITKTGSIFSGNVKTWYNAILHHSVLIFICIGIAFMCAIANYYTGVFNMETYEMRKRSQYKTLISDIIIAIVCGIGIAISTVRNNILVQVGFAIAITVLPVLVNSGLYLALYFIEMLKDYVDRDEEKIKEYKSRIINTFVITFINILMVCLASYITYFFIC